MVTRDLRALTITLTTVGHGKGHFEAPERGMSGLLRAPFDRCASLTRYHSASVELNAVSPRGRGVVGVGREEMTVAEKIVPTCRYHNIPLVRTSVIDPPLQSNLFYMAGLHPSRTSIIGAGYIFAIYECTQCSYLELHDPDKL